MQVRHTDIKPTYDIVAKKIFSDPEITQQFIEDILDLEIRSVQILEGNQIHLGQDEDQDRFFTAVDVLAELDNGVQVIIEIQIVQQHAFLSRLWAYICSQVYENMEKERRKGSSTHHIYSRLAPVYAIAIVEGEYFADDRAFRVFSLQDKVSHEEMKVQPLGFDTPYPLVELAFLELNKYNLDIGTNKKQWLEFFGNKPFSHRPVDMVERAEGMLEMTHWTKEERAMLDEKRRIREIRIAEEEYFWHKGVEEGIEQGMARGIEQSKLEIANNMLNDGTPLDLVSKFTGLSLSQLQQLKTGHLS